MVLMNLNAVYAAFGAAENFDSYSTGVALDGLSGGTGWVSNWTKSSSGEDTIQVAPAGGQGGKAVFTAYASQYYRDFTSFSEGTISIDIYSTTATPPDFSGIILNAATGNNSKRCYVRLGPTSGQVQAYNGATYVQVGSFSVNTWVNIKVRIDSTNQLNKFGVSVDDGSWSSWMSCDGTFSDWEGIVFDSGDAYLYYDDINDGTAPPPPSTPSIIRCLLGMGLTRGCTLR